MRILRASLVCCLVTALRLGAVYAPVPELEQGKAFTVYLAAGAHYDSNIFGGSDQQVDSMVYEFKPSLVFNASLDAKTFASAAYRLSLDHMVDRPGDKNLDSHEFMARLAHTFTPQTELDLSDTYQIAKNPQSLLPGLATVVNTDQSYRRNQLDLRFATGLTRRTGLTFKARTTRFDYDEAGLGRALNRDEHLAGLAATHAVLPELQAVSEYRHQRIVYDEGGETKDKRSDFILTGADYNVNARFALSGRLGLEHRRRRGDRTETTPYAELGAKHDFSQGSYVAVGYGYSIEETSNVELYSDIAVNRFFVNVQQQLRPKFTATGSLTWEPSRLHGRSGIAPDANETNSQLGLALIYRPAKTWSVSLTLDYDRIRSDAPGRQLERTRTGANAKYAF